VNLEKIVKKIQFHKEILIKLKNDMIKKHSPLAPAYITHIRSLEGFLAYLEKEFKAIGEQKED